jgi:metal-responsive CopG/Arc/MetJ family transcriptional regulator
MKLTITLDDRLLADIDEYADKYYMSRSGFIAQACTQFLTAFQMQQTLKDMSIAMQKIANTGTVDEETQKQLEDIERLVTLFYKK